MNKGEIMKRPKETLTSREIIEKLTPALEKSAKEFIDDFLTIFACYAKFSYPQHERICRNPYFTYEDGAGFYSSGSSIGCREEIVLGHEFTTALYAWGLWGENRITYDGNSPRTTEEQKDFHAEYNLFQRAGIRFCECVLELFPQCEAVLTDDDERIEEGNGWKYLEIVRSPNGGFEHIHLSDEEYTARWI